MPGVGTALGALAWVMTAPAAGQVRLFDMGPASAPVWQGADAVPEDLAFSDELGYGWETTEGLVAAKRPVADALGSDFVQGGGTFVVVVEPGNYGVRVVLCDPGGGERPPRSWSESYTITANGEEVVATTREGRPSFDAQYLANWESDWEPGESLFAKYVGVHDDSHDFVAKAPDGRIRLGFEPDLPVAAVAVWPAIDAATGIAVMEQITEARRKAFDDSYERAPQPTGLRPGTYSQRESKRGYAVWERRVADKVYPYTQPSARDRTRRIDVLAFQGELEPFSICVRPLRSMQATTVTLPELKGPGGAVLGPDEIDISFVKYVERLTKPGVYRIEPRELLPADPRDLTGGVTRQYWITLTVAEGARPGKYRGKLTVEAEGMGSVAIKVQLTVLPVRLDRARTRAGMVYTPPEEVDFGWDEAVTRTEAMRARMRAELADMREHGMTLIAPEPASLVTEDAAGEVAPVEPAWARLEEMLAACDEAGFEGPVLVYQLAYRLMEALDLRPRLTGGEWESGEPFDDRFTKTYADAVRLAIGRAGGRDLLYHASDGLSECGIRGGEWGLEHLELLREIAPTVPGGLTLCGSLTGRAEAGLIPELDIAALNGSFGLTAEELRTEGTELWLQNLGWNRFTWGYYPWRCGAAGRLEWNYHARPTGTWDPHNHLTNVPVGVSPGPDGPLRNVDWELAREGIDDARLVATLERLIAESADRKGASRAAAEAEADLAWLRTTIRPDLAHYADQAGYWDGAMYSKLKQMLGRHCERLAGPSRRGQGREVLTTTTARK